MKEQIIKDLMEAVHDVAKIKGEIEALRNENNFLRELLTKQLRKHDVIGSFSMQDLMLYYQDAENFDFTSKAIEVLNSMVNDR